MKSPLKSKTVWFAVLFFVVSVAGLFGYVDYSPSQDVTEIVNVAVSVIVLILRFVTDEGIEF